MRRLSPTLQAYGNRHGGSGVRAFAILGDTLSVEFVDGAVYDYRRRDVGARRFDAACAAARTGRGLSTCVSRHLRDRFAIRHANRADWARAHRDNAAPSARRTSSKP
ncbi:hypothetical protein [Luteimonas terrae]|uniref:KTSC domain-containing protein n=1 Tax=Luteimonas terrae TaxID=1530191 RepID=A0A4R5U664_9GAMM|nr:hypothetical protein [Luteimonas terrae]TDK29570.1 hypothetical protein E2F49_14465 [Luteimonas terrae]